MYTLSIATKDFISHCTFEKNLSSKTLKAYKIDLRQLLEFVLKKKYSIEIIKITKVELRDYIENLSELKPKSIKRKIATIKAMFNYLEFEDKVITNPFRKMRIKIKEPSRLPNVLNISEITSIFKSAYDNKNVINIESGYDYFESLRNIVVVELLFATEQRIT